MQDQRDPPRVELYLTEEEETGGCMDSPWKESQAPIVESLCCAKELRFYEDLCFRGSSGQFT